MHELDYNSSYYCRIISLLSASNAMKTIVLIDDHQIVRDGIKSLLESSGEYRVVGEGTNVDDALSLLEKHQPDVLVTDISLANSSGIDLTRFARSRFPSLPILILSMHETEEHINDSLHAGANGYLLKDCSREEMLSAIEKILAGEKFISRSASQIMMNHLLNRSSNPSGASDIPELTKRELEVLELVHEGLSNKEIASKLFLSVRTVDTHRYNILQKLDAKNTVDLLNKARRLNLISKK